MSGSFSDTYKSLFEAEETKVTRRKCFVSYYAGDTLEVEQFLSDFGNVFIPKVIGVSDGDDLIDSGNTEYIMSRIRYEYLGDSTVTICLIGKCTHSRRYVDWELKTSLRRGTYIPNGLLGILLPSAEYNGELPPRFEENWDEDEANVYAICRAYPTSKDMLREYIDTAYSRRFTHADLINNSQIMHRYNRRCSAHNETH